MILQNLKPEERKQAGNMKACCKLLKKFLNGLNVLAGKCFNSHPLGELLGRSRLQQTDISHGK
jgi:hypothetical protein